VVTEDRPYRLAELERLRHAEASSFLSAVPPACHKQVTSRGVV
jgi:hypothetical protein